MTDLSDLSAVSPATKAALAALAASLSQRLAPVYAELTRTATEQIAATLAPRIQEIAANLAPELDEIAAEAFRQINTAGLQAAVVAATREITEQAAVIEALENSGYRALVYKLASEHHGFVSTAMAQAAGVPSVEVRKLASRSGMSNLARGLYRVDGIDGGEQAPYAEAVLRVGEDAHLVGDSVLAFHDLALVNPRRITVGTPRRVRRALPAHIRLVHTRTDPADLTEYDGVPSVTVERAIKDSIGSVMPERLREATRRAADEGLLRRRVADALLAKIGTAA